MKFIGGVLNRTGSPPPPPTPPSLVMNGVEDNAMLPPFLDARGVIQGIQNMKQRFKIVSVMYYVIMYKLKVDQFTSVQI